MLNIVFWKGRCIYSGLFYILLIIISYLLMESKITVKLINSGFIE